VKLRRYFPVQQLFFPTKPIKKGKGSLRETFALKILDPIDALISSAPGFCCHVQQGRGLFERKQGR
jgi:hypothetical protein